MQSSGSYLDGRRAENRPNLKNHASVADGGVGDGAARVFLSGVAADGSSARIAINGQTLQVIPAGGKVAVEGTDCAVSVDSIDRGRVAFGYACGG